MLLYQSTLNNYSIGDRVVPSTPTTFYPEATAEIGRHRPPDLPSSSICLLATDDLAFLLLLCIAAAVGSRHIKIYEVEMDTYHRASIISSIRSKGG